MSFATAYHIEGKWFWAAALHVEYVLLHPLSGESGAMRVLSFGACTENPVSHWFFHDSGQVSLPVVSVVHHTWSWSSGAMSHTYCPSRLFVFLLADQVPWASGIQQEGSHDLQHSRHSEELRDAARTFG